MIINARELRGDKESFTDVIKKHPNLDRPGYYRWWAKKDELEKLFNTKLLDKKYLDLIKLKPSGKGELESYYHIYTGVAIKESLYDRLNWHINQKHTENAIKYGILSTLRQSISSLIYDGKQEQAEETTNKFIDELKVEYFPLDHEIKSDEAKIIIEAKEKEDINNYILILNIKGNKKNELKDFKNDLKQLRKQSRENK